MDIVITPFKLIVALSGLLFIATVVALLYRRKIRLALVLVVVALITAATTPVKLATNTRSHNNAANLQILQKHQQTLRDVPPRIVVKESQAEFLARKKAELTSDRN